MHSASDSVLSVSDGALRECRMHTRLLPTCSDRAIRGDAPWDGNGKKSPPQAEKFLGLPSALMG
ncbi:unnamed protein product [Ectocarpus sp. 13 AM-2016]